MDTEREREGRGHIKRKEVYSINMRHQHFDHVFYLWMEKGATLLMRVATAPYLAAREALATR